MASAQLATRNENFGIALENCKKSPLNHFKENPLKNYGMDNA